VRAAVRPDAAPRHANARDGVGQGSDWKTLWTGMFERTVRQWWALDHPVLCDDLRFPNEVDTIRRLGGTIVRVERESPRGAGGHTSETSIDAIVPDIVPPNNGTLAELVASAVDLSTRFDPLTA
jgi:hypothetical protein